MYVSMLISLLFQIKLDSWPSRRKNIIILGKKQHALLLLFINNKNIVTSIRDASSAASPTNLGFHDSSRQKTNHQLHRLEVSSPNVNQASMFFSFCFSTPGEINGFLKKDKLKTLYREYVPTTTTYVQLSSYYNENGTHTAQYCSN